MPSAQEVEPLVKGAQPIRQLGFEIVDDSSEAHYVLVFAKPTATPTDDEDDSGGCCRSLPCRPADADKKQTLVETWDKIFVDKDSVSAPDNLANMSKLEFNDAVRGKVMEILQGECCGFTCTAYESADENNVIVRIKLVREQARKAIAEQESIRVKLKPEAYEVYEQEVPTDAFNAGKFLPNAKVIVDHVQLSKKTESIADLNWREVDLIRMVRRRINSFIDTDQLIKAEVAVDFFASHNYKELMRLQEAGWNDVKAILQYPGTKHVDIVRDYFAEETGFFFHWLNFFTRYLVYAGCMGAVAWIAVKILEISSAEGEDIDENSKQSNGQTYKDDPNVLVWPEGDFPRSYVRLIFTLFMCLWGAVYTKHYQQRSNFKIMEWGMKDYAIAAKVRPKYKPEYRGSYKDQLQHAGHWCLVVFFIVETIWVVFEVSDWRLTLGGYGTEEYMFGLTGNRLKSLCPLLITANIKIVDQLWKRLSPALTELENWRTDQDLKNSKVIKMFIVKFVVYYYPFLFIAFLQEHWQPELTPDMCLAELRQQIYIYFPVEVGFTIGLTLFEIVRAKMNLRSKCPKDVTKIYHTELQFHSPHYEDGLEDTMELILGFGFLMMFTTSVTIMPLLALVSNLVQIRLIAYRLSFANKRVPPRGQEGFGAWADIVQVITFVGVLVNVGEACFVMKPLRGLPMEKKLAWFLLFEHALLMLKLFITTAVPSVADNQKFIEEHNSTAVEIIRWRSRAGRNSVTATPTDGTTSGSKFAAVGMADIILVDDSIPRVNLKDPKTWDRPASPTRPRP